MVKFVNKFLLNIFPYDTIHRGTRLIQANRVTGKIPLVTAGAEKQGVSAYIQKNTELFKPNSITIDMFGNVFYRNYNFFADDNIIVLHNDNISQEAMLYLTSVLNKTLSVGFSYGKQFRMQSLKFVQIQVPITHTGELDTAYMASYVQKIEASYVQKIEAYLAVLGYKSLADCQLNQHDLNVLSAKPIMKGFKAIKMFDQPIRGKRIKSDDRITGTLPFITAGVDKQGISAYIGNNTHIFPKNSITIDMFGNVFYRYFQYGADDHVTVLTSNKYNKKQMLYLTSCLSKSLSYNQYTYSKNFYPKDVTAITLSLPVTPSGTPDWQFMEDYITAIEKLKVLKIKQFLDTKINAYQNIIK